MKKAATFWRIILLLFCLVGCGAENGQMLSAASGEGSTQKSSSGSVEAEKTTPPTQSVPPDVAVNGQEAKNKSENNGGNTTMKISVKSDDYEIVYELNDSRAARELYEQLPLTTEPEPFSNNEMTFYPQEKLSTGDTPLSSGKAGTLSYYAPWGDVVMFYADCDPNDSLYGLGTVVSGADNISRLSGSIVVSVCE